MLKLSMRYGEEGFTLIEAVLVVALLAILAAAVIIRNPIERLRVNGAAAKLKSDIRYAQKLAVTGQERAGIVLSANGYGIYADIVTSALANSPEGGCSSDASGKFVVDFTAPRCSELEGITLSYMSNVVAFDSLGSPVDASGAPLGTQTLTVSGPGGARAVTVEAQTGRVGG